MSNSSPTRDRGASKVTVSPQVFSLITYDSGEIAEIVEDLAARLGIANPIHVEVDETTPLGKMSAVIDGTSSDATITVRVESGALEDTQRFTNFGRRQAYLSLGRMMLRARDRLRPDFADAPDDLALTLQQNAAWDAYCAGRLDEIGLEPNQQRFRYNFRNRFGFTDDADRRFEELWAADDLGWADLTGPT